MDWKKKDSEQILKDINSFCKKIRNGMTASNPYIVDCRLIFKDQSLLNVKRKLT